MAPNVTSAPVTELPSVKIEETLKSDWKSSRPGNQESYKIDLVWRNILLFAYLHVAAIYGMYLMATSASWYTIAWAVFMYQCGAFGITAGAHRLWAHRSYKAKLPLRIMLMIFNLISFQNDIHEWSRDHRVHHKYSETDADPHNATRGFFFSHVGWLLCRKHPLIKEKGKGIDMSDLEKDAVVAFQKKYYLTLMPIATFVIPTWVPMYFWGESFVNAWFVSTMFRYAFTLNMTWLVNSAAHMWGQKPYDASINPAENLMVALGAAGEGWHNYHHVFPWDYKAAELGNYRANPTTMFIDFMAKIGWAYDLKTVPKEVVAKRCQRTGDGSLHHAHDGTSPWGWGDRDISQEDIDDTALINNKSN